MCSFVQGWVLVKRLLGVLTLVLVAGGINKSEANTDSLHQIFYTAVNVSGLCFRLTNATHQIGCSASSTNTHGVLYHGDTTEALQALENHAPHAPYIVLLEPGLFTSVIVKKLKSMEPTVQGILLRYRDRSAGPDITSFSPERQCPNDGFGSDSNSCTQTWNPDGTDLLFTDFGDFPIFILSSEDFDKVVNCSETYNSALSGGLRDYPLCSVEMRADMASSVSTPVCQKRQSTFVSLLSSIFYCDPLGDKNVWGSIFNLSSSNESRSDKVIMLTAKLDSVSFFPSAYSYGGSAEVAAIATLLAVLDQLGVVKRKGEVIGLTKPIIYSFFHGESWDYIGSSRMAYDMKNDRFPEDTYDLPKMSLKNISYFLELGQLGLVNNSRVFLHGDMNSTFVQSLKNYSGEGLLVQDSNLSSLPPGSLGRFLREGVMEGNNLFRGSILTSFDDSFNNRFYGSRYDDRHNFGGRTFEEVADDLAKLATSVAKAALHYSEPICSSSSVCDEVIGNISARADLIVDVLDCFLSNSSCALFQEALVQDYANNLVSQPLQRYVTVATSTNPETLIMQQLVARLTANNEVNLTTPVLCTECLSKITDMRRDMSVNITWMQSGADEKDPRKRQCFCVDSYTYTHEAKSPAFEGNTPVGAGSRNYSTWAESRWTAVSMQLYLVNHPYWEVGVLLGGMFLTLVYFLISFQCVRKGTFIFDIGRPLYSTFAHS